MSYTKFSKEVTKWLKDNGLPCYGTANDSPEETKARLDAWMRGSKEILRQWITEKRYRELISCAHGGWYQDDVIFEPWLNILWRTTCLMNCGFSANAASVFLRKICWPPLNLRKRSMGRLI